MEDKALVRFRLFSRAQCREIVRRLRAHAGWKPGRVRAGGRAILTPGDRRTWDLPLDGLPAAARRFRAAVRRLVRPAIASLWHCRTRLTADARFVRYPPGGHYKLHHDAAAGGRSRRVFSVVCYLNEDFQGGRTVFPRQRRLVRPLTGMAVVFPSRLTHPHYAETVRKGEKYVITAWLSLA